ncbi:MAG: hypothetical protein JWM52_506 [Candidatus Saccharibacteria bacterium]|nr:hypothetical protein [Candidatus Saccharibacteria bacterium]
MDYSLIKEMIMKLLKKIFSTFAFAVLIAAPVMTVAAPQTTFAAPTCENRVLGMPVWFRGLTTGSGTSCEIMSPSDPSLGADAGARLSNFIWRVALNVIEIGLFLVGYIALFFVLYGGFMYLTGGSVPGQIEKARLSILHAVIGLAISMGSIGITNLIFRLING